MPIYSTILGGQTPSDAPTENYRPDRPNVPIFSRAFHGSGRVWSGLVGSGRVGSGRVGSGRVG